MSMSIYESVELFFRTSVGCNLPELEVNLILDFEISLTLYCPRGLASLVSNNGIPIG